MGVLENLEPKSVFYFFEEICNIPHGSKNEAIILCILQKKMDFITDKMKRIMY